MTLVAPATTAAVLATAAAGHGRDSGAMGGGASVVEPISCTHMFRTDILVLKWEAMS